MSNCDSWPCRCCFDRHQHSEKLIEDRRQAAQLKKKQQFLKQLVTLPEARCAFHFKTMGVTKKFAKRCQEVYKSALDSCIALEQRHKIAPASEDWDAPPHFDVQSGSMNYRPWGFSKRETTGISSGDQNRQEDSFRTNSFNRTDSVAVESPSALSKEKLSPLLLLPEENLPQEKEEEVAARFQEKKQLSPQTTSLSQIKSCAVRQMPRFRAQLKHDPRKPQSGPRNPDSSGSAEPSISTGSSERLIFDSDQLSTPKERMILPHRRKKSRKHQQKYSTYHQDRYSDLGYHPSPYHTTPQYYEAMPSLLPSMCPISNFCHLETPPHAFGRGHSNDPSMWSMAYMLESIEHNADLLKAQLERSQFKQNIALQKYLRKKTHHLEQKAARQRKSSDPGSKCVDLPKSKTIDVKSNSTDVKRLTPQITPDQEKVSLKKLGDTIAASITKAAQALSDLKQKETIIPIPPQRPQQRRSRSVSKAPTVHIPSRISDQTVKMVTMVPTSTPTGQVPLVLPVNAATLGPNALQAPANIFSLPQGGLVSGWAAGIPYNGLSPLKQTGPPVFSRSWDPNCLPPTFCLDKLQDTVKSGPPTAVTQQHHTPSGTPINAREDHIPKNQQDYGAAIRQNRLDIVPTLTEIETEALKLHQQAEAMRKYNGTAIRGQMASQMGGQMGGQTGSPYQASQISLQASGTTRQASGTTRQASGTTRQASASEISRQACGSPIYVEQASNGPSVQRTLSRVTGSVGDEEATNVRGMVHEKQDDGRIAVSPVVEKLGDYFCLQPIGQGAKFMRVADLRRMK